jgi:hypothetical protein
MKTQTQLLFALLLLASTTVAQTTPTILPFLPPSVSTIPSNGDVNPYGITFVPKNVIAGYTIRPGDILVSNFNNNQNLQGTGTTLMRIASTGAVSTFFTAPSSASGMTAAIGVLTNGLVLAGNLQTFDGTAATVQPGRLAVLDGFGDFLGTIGTQSVVDGPWAMAVRDTGNNGTGSANAFVSNILSGVISRFDLTYTPTNLSASALVLSNGFNHRLDPAALVLGPSGLAYNAPNDTLYVASSSDNAVYAIATATAPHSAPVSPVLVFQDSTHLHGPVGLQILPNGHFLIANSDGSNANPNEPSELVEFTSTGQFISQMPLDPNNGGAFGVAVNNLGWGTVRVATVDDNTNRLNITTTVIP